jgi:hypothetical protein
VIGFLLYLDVFLGAVAAASIVAHREASTDAWRKYVEIKYGRKISVEE